MANGPDHSPRPSCDAHLLPSVKVCWANQLCTGRLATSKTRSDVDVVMTGETLEIGQFVE